MGTTNDSSPADGEKAGAGARAERPAGTAPLFRAEDVSKSFAAIDALRQVGLDLERGTVHAIVGHNGAGKSTLMNIVSGVLRPDSGRLLLDGEPVAFRAPRDAQERGISMVHQELSILGDLTVPENIFLGREPLTGRCLIDRRTMTARTERLLSELDLRLPLDVPSDRLSVGERQMVEIARAVSWTARVVILDEPTAALSRREQERLFVLIDRLRAQGIGILHVSHRLDEVLQLADTVTVLRDGKNIATLTRGAYDHASLVSLMVGSAAHEASVTRDISGDACLEISGLTARSAGLDDISLSVDAGEIVGLAGMLGSGRSELFECLFGLRHPDSGTIRIGGADERARSPIHAMRKGIGLVPEDRKVQGIFPDTPLWKNVALASVHDIFARFGVVKAQEAPRRDRTDARGDP